MSSLGPPIARAAIALAAAILPFPSYAQSSDCPEDLIGSVPEFVLKRGGVFYLADRQWPRWELLEEDNFAIPADRLEMVYIPPSNLCVQEEDAPLRCGDHGFIVVKTYKKSGAVSDGQVMLTHGTKFSRETGFPDTNVTVERYQNFHTARTHPADRIVKSKWHQSVMRGSTRVASTYHPIAKKFQYTFTQEALADGYRRVRLMRFQVPGPDGVVCVPFDVTWNSKDMTLELEIMRTDPVVVEDGWNPDRFTLRNGGRDG